LVPLMSFIEPESDRDILIRIDEKVKVLPELDRRVKSLESDRDKIKALSILGGIGGGSGIFAAILNYFARR
jgi:hypothetical protein